MFDRFETGYKTTIGVDVSTHEVTITQGPIKLILWGADGDFGASIIETVYLRGAWAAVIVADASRPWAPAYCDAACSAGLRARAAFPRH